MLHILKPLQGLLPAKIQRLSTDWLTDSREVLKLNDWKAIENRDCPVVFACIIIKILCMVLATIDGHLGNMTEHIH